MAEISPVAWWAVNFVHGQYLCPNLNHAKKLLRNLHKD